MRYIRSGYEGKAESLNVMLFNDWHIGSDAADLALAERCIKFALDNKENTRILLNGDLIEGITRLSKGDIYSQKLSPKEQVNYVVELLEPVKDQIDALVIGNHDDRIERETSIDVVEQISRYLGIGDKYLGIRGVAGFSWNGCHYSIDMHHGTGGGGTIASVENAMKRLWKSDSDIIYCGHWHKEFAKPVKRYALDVKNERVVEEKRWMICGNTIVNTADYAARGGFEEGFPSQAVLKLSGIKHKRDIEVSWIR